LTQFRSSNSLKYRRTIENVLNKKREEWTLSQESVVVKTGSIFASSNQRSFALEKLVSIDP
jgi:hypothetical protein